MSVFSWWALLIIQSLLVFPWLKKFIGFSQDEGWGITRSLSILYFGTLSWLLFLLGVSKALLWVLVIHIIIALWKKEFLFKEISKSIKRIISTELVFLLIYILFLSIRYQYPEIYTGEKRMDFSMLSYFYKLGATPFIEDPWHAGRPLTYYYLGYFIFAKVANFLTIDIFIAYNLILATIPALLSISILSFVNFFTRRWKLAVWSGFAASLFCNFESILALFRFGNKLNRSYFWSNTRIFLKSRGGSYFAEHPAWSFLFADLHPHVIAYPFCILALYFIFRTIFDSNFEKRPSLSILFLTSFSLGGLLSINSWDFLFSVFVFGVGLLLTYKKELFRQKIIYPSIVVLTAPLFFLPLASSIFHGPKKNMSSALPPLNHIGHFFAQTGQYIIPIAFVFCFLLYKNIKKISLKPSDLFLSICPFLLYFFNMNIGWDFGIWMRIIFISLLLFVSFSLFRITQQRILTTLILSSLFLSLFADHFILMDRMNTLFKFYNYIYIILFLAFVFLIHHLLSLKLPKKILNPLMLSFFIMMTYGSYVNYLALIQSFPPKAMRQNSLNSFDILKKKFPKESRVVQWINENIEGVPVIIEAPGKSFSNSSPVAIFTGLKSFLTWPNHIKIRGARNFEITNKQEVIHNIYFSKDPINAFNLMIKNNIDYLFIGPNEFKIYHKESLDKFKNQPGFFEKVYSTDSTYLYKVNNKAKKN